MKKEYLIIGGVVVLVVGYLIYKSKSQVNLATKDGMPYSIDTSIIKNEIVKAISTGETQEVKYKGFYCWIVPNDAVSVEIILANDDKKSKHYHYDNNGVFVNVTVYNPNPR